MSRLDTYPITISLANIGTIEGELYRGKAPQSVEMIWYELPLSGRARVHENGGAYFLIDKQAKPEHPTFDVEPGTIAYWPQAKAIFLFWDKVKPYSEVNIIGKITSDLTVLKKVKNLTRITIKKRD